MVGIKDDSSGRDFAPAKTFWIIYDNQKLCMELPFTSESTILKELGMLAERFSKFKAILDDENNYLLSGLVIIVNRTVVQNLAKRNEVLEDECGIIFFAPYSGG